MEHETPLTGRTTTGVVRVGNTVRRPINARGSVSAFIDFDAAHPGSRLEDLGYAAWLWIDIGNDELSLAERAAPAGVREWANNCRGWVERNRDKLSSICGG